MVQARFARLVLAAWVVLLSVDCLRPLLQPLNSTIYPTFAHAGVEFAAGRRLYDVPAPNTDVYRYSPLVAAIFVPFGLMPLGIGGVVWRVVGVGMFLTGLVAWARRACPAVPLPAIFLGARFRYRMAACITVRPIHTSLV